ncbi:MAG TPA: carbohydrate porin [Albitalea sp.]|nr:carbohydrate porin [Albitalea sp.]
MTTITRQPAAWAAIAFTTALFGATPAQAVDWGGYFRAGPGASKSDASRACYGLNGPGLKYRLGNECDFYGEFLLSQGMKADGVDYKAYLMTNLWEPTSNGDTAKLGINQMYVEGKGYDIAPNTTLPVCAQLPPPWLRSAPPAPTPWTGAATSARARGPRSPTRRAPATA